jgi:hypothetical protein
MSCPVAASTPHPSLRPKHKGWLIEHDDEEDAEGPRPGLVVRRAIGGVSPVHGNRQVTVPAEIGSLHAIREGTYRFPI